jgi:hypothetical protein
MSRQATFDREARAAMQSPTMSSPQYNRFKYYSALKTGYKHIGGASNLPPEEQE